MSGKKTVSASQGIEAGLVEAFLKEGGNVVATSRNATRALTASPHLVLVDGDIAVGQRANPGNESSARPPATGITLDVEPQHHRS